MILLEEIDDDENFADKDEKLKSKVGSIVDYLSLPDQGFTVYKNTIVVFLVN